MSNIYGVNKWISVKDKMPDTRGKVGHSISVLIWNPFNQCVFMAIWRDGEGWEDWTNGQHKHCEDEITYWMHLPEPPEAS